MIRAPRRGPQRWGHASARALLALLLAAGAGSGLAQTEAAVMKRAAELRESPSESAKPVAPLAADAPVTRLGERQGPWIRVRDAQGATGWVHLFDVGSPSAGGSGAGGFAGGALRSVTGLFNRNPSPRTTTATSTIGIRGLGAEDIAQAQPDVSAVARMEALRQSEPQARQFAREAALVPVQVDPLPAPTTPSAQPFPGVTP